MLGDLIRQIRKTQEATQYQFADSLGISREHLSKVERGLVPPSAKLLKKISERYCIPLPGMIDALCEEKKNMYISEFYKELKEERKKNGER